MPFDTVQAGMTPNLFMQPLTHCPPQSCVYLLPAGVPVPEALTLGGTPCSSLYRLETCPGDTRLVGIGFTSNSELQGSIAKLGKAMFD